MTSSDKQWEEVNAAEPDQERTGPFAIGVPLVDGYAFTPDTTDPELRYQPQAKRDQPRPPTRQAPKRIRDQVRPTGVWQPGGPARPAITTVRAPRAHYLRGLLTGLIPLGLLGGGIYLVMRLYGF